MHAVKLTIVALGVNEIQRGVVIAELLLTNCPDYQSTMTHDEPRRGKDDDSEES
jgi:hypothetical protein